MAVDMFLKLDGIDGESTDAAHPDEIVIQGFEWGESNKATHGAGGGRGAGKVEMQDIVIRKYVDKATPLLMLACATGQHIPEGVLTLRKAGEEQQEYMTITLTDVLVSSVQTTGTREDTIPMEQITLNFNEVEWEYKPQQDDGSLGAPIKAGYDLAANVKK